MDVTVTTYGGGEILYQIFTAIAKLSNQSYGLLYPMLGIFATIGLFIAISKSLFSQSPEYFFKKYFIPTFFTCYLIMLPTAEVHVEDVMTTTAKSVSGVPFVLAKSASIISSFGYLITKGLEQVLHMPDGSNYMTTGMIFGAETYIDSKTYKIRNANLEYNLKNFCKNCVLYDLALQKYSFDDLKKSGDIWEFLKVNTSKVRMINYYGLNPKDSQENTYISCKEAINTLEPIFNKEKEYFSKQEIIKNLPLRYQALSGLRIEADKLVSQQLMFAVLKDGLKGSKFAESRAYSQQRATYQMVGSLAGTSLVTMRAIFEALIYISFIFILPLTLIPGGYVFAKNWLAMAGWIQLWPPFYAILDFIMQIVSTARSENILISSARNSLCYIDQMGLENFYADVEALSGYLMMSVPFISYAILKGGVQSLMHMAGSMMTPSHSAATGAANEMTSGNYNYGNISYGSSSFGNETKLQRNTAPSLSSGFMQYNQGSYLEVYGQEKILNQSTSNLRHGLISEESINQSLNDSFQKATSLSENSQKMYQESLSMHGRTSCDLVETLGNSNNYTSNISTSERDDYVASARTCQNIAKNLSEATGIDENACYQFHANGGINGAGFAGIQLSRNQSAALHEAINSSEYASQNNDFQESYQKLTDFSSTRAYNCLNEEGIRKSDAFNQSLDEVNSSSQQHSANLSNLEQISQQRSLYLNNSDRMTKNLNQDFVDFASERYGGFVAASHTLRRGNECEKDGVYRDFFNHQVAKYQIPTGSQESFKPKYDAVQVKMLDKGTEASNLASLNTQLERGLSFNRGDVNQEKQNLSVEKGHFRSSVEGKSNEMKHEIDQKAQSLGETFNEKRDEPLREKVFSKTGDAMKSGWNTFSSSFLGRGFRSLGDELNRDLLEDEPLSLGGINQKQPMWKEDK